jgi:hypothetical protein
MRLTLIGTFLAIGLCSTPSLHAEEKRSTPRIDADIVWSEIYQNKTNLYVLVSNPQDFDIYVGRITSHSHEILWDVPKNLPPGTFREAGEVVNADGIALRGPQDFMLVRARAKRLLTLCQGCRVSPGENHCKVQVSSWVDPKIQLPWNYVVIGERDFTFSIEHVDTLRSR